MGHGDMRWVEKNAKFLGGRKHIARERKLIGEMQRIQYLCILTYHILTTVFYEK